MPWQHLVYRVGSEFDPLTELPLYREVIATVPRQSGKSIMVLVFAVERALFRDGPQRMAYTAQTGWDARKKIVDDFAPLHLLTSVYQADVERVLRGSGNEGVVFKSGSRLDVLSSSGEAGHGRTLHLGIIDEAFADTDDRREQAMLPAMATIADAQLLVFSTAGDGRSAYLRRKVEAGRVAVNDGRTEGIAYFEWSAPDHADPDDVEVWARCMPALGVTIDEAVVRHARQTMSDGEFRRAFLNQWVEGGDRVIPGNMWIGVLDPKAAPSGSCFIAVDGQPDQSSASIAVADRAGSVEVAVHADGVSWTLEKLVDMAVRLKAPVVVDVSGPVGHLAAQLKARRVKVIEFKTQDVKHACAEILDRISDGRIRVRPNLCDHCGQVPITAAVEGATRQPIGDGWKWARKSIDTDISPLMAVTLAVGATAGIGGTPPTAPLVAVTR